MIETCLLRARFALTGVMILTSFFVSGCGSKQGERATVVGKVTVDGSPANSGRVVFTGTDGQSVSGEIMPDGNYRAIDVLAGPAKVAVKPPPRLPPRPKGMEGLPGSGLKGPPVPIPKKYHDVNTSGLTTTITTGTSKYNVELSTK